ncbi:Purine-cytosine permease fcyB [Penicillium subrubescens]|uniref:Purine-cytosine permease fcyB n=1 Tax=Penicillium subrubescens TaxID=1316194 RepID=A0A1Q5U1A6_9EURO|nr:Purine-cytosine permease fcyB [Penicillium subrubescens]
MGNDCWRLCLLYAPTGSTASSRLVLFGGPLCPFLIDDDLGTAFGGAIPSIPSWTSAYAAGGVGGVLGEILISRLGGFGRFILILLGMSIVTTSARDMYSMSLFTVAVVPWLGRVPRVFILCGAAAVMVGVAIAASRSFLSTLSTLVSIAGYMTGPTVCVFLIEWLYFRKADPSKLDPTIWNDAAALPSGIPAIISSLVPWALIITSMSTGWYVGPIAMRISDLAYELGTVTAGLLYFPLRLLEVRWLGHV